MAFDDLIPNHDQIHEIHVIYLALACFITIFSLISLVVKDRLYMSEAFIAVIVGIVLGPLVANVLHGNNNIFTLELLRIVIAIQCMACAVDLPYKYIWKEGRSFSIFLLPVTLYMWVVSAIGIHFIFDLDFFQSFVIAACLSPTDPVLSNSIVKGKFAEAHIPTGVRLILSAESGANDGLGTPLLLLAFYCWKFPPQIAIVVAYQVILSILVAFIIASIVKYALKAAERYNFIDKESMLSFSIALAITVVGVMSLMGSNDLLAVFVAGTVLTWDMWFNEQIVNSSFQEVIDSLLNLSLFVYIGSIVPWSTFTSAFPLWRYFVFQIYIIFLRRIPIIFCLQKFIPVLKSPKEVFFAGWFGPIGAGAVYYAHLAIVIYSFPPSPILEIVFFTVLTSIVVHGGSVGLFHFTLSRISTYNDWDVRHRLAVMRFFGATPTVRVNELPPDLRDDETPVDSSINNDIKLQEARIQNSDHETLDSQFNEKETAFMVSNGTTSSESSEPHLNINMDQVGFDYSPLKNALSEGSGNLSKKE